MTNTELLVQVYAAFNKRDIDAVFAHMNPDVDWPNAMENTRVHGLDELRAYWVRQWGMLDPHVDPVSIADSGDGAIVSVHQVVRDLGGAVLVDQMVEHAYILRNGLIERMDIQSTKA
jgi:hypothetical protein